MIQGSLMAFTGNASSAVRLITSGIVAWRTTGATMLLPWYLSCSKMARPTVYVVWHPPKHPEKPWAVGCEIRPGCLKVAGYMQSKRLADLLAQQPSDGDY